MVFNFDETCWKLYLGPRRVLAEKGTTTVKLKSFTGEKLSVTAFGTISASGNKFPLWVITKGKTPRTLKKFGEHPEIIFKYTESGWAKEEVIFEYISWLSAQANGEPCLLIMDVYPSHRTPAVIEHALEMNLEILFVPAGGTALYQPLDARVFGELKSRARSAFQRLAFQEGIRGATYEQSISILTECWEKISVQKVLKAWDVVGFPIEE